MGMREERGKATGGAEGLKGDTAGELVEALARNGRVARINVVVLKDGMAEGIFYTEREARNYIRKPGGLAGPKPAQEHQP